MDDESQQTQTQPVDITTKRPMNRNMRLRPLDEDILRELRSGGQNLPANVADLVAKNRQYVNERLRLLDDYGLAENIGNGVYRVTLAGEVALEFFDKRRHDDFDDLVWSRVEEIEQDDMLNKLVDIGALEKFGGRFVFTQKGITALESEVYSEECFQKYIDAVTD